MRNRWLVSLTVAILLASAATQSSKRSAEVTAAHSTLQLTLKTNQNVFRMSDTLRMETRLTNVGNEAVYIWESDLCWNPARGLSMRITGSDGTDVQSSFLLDCVPPPPRQGDVYQFIKLAPKAFYGHNEQFKVSDLVNGPGDYDVAVTFNSFLRADFIAKYYASDPISKLPLWTMDSPTITSNRIHISVKR
jgi:hypothetical protein